MIAKASISTGWRVRLGGMTAMFVGFCAFFLYDGFIGYPKQQNVYTQFVDHVVKANSLDASKVVPPVDHTKFMEFASKESGKSEIDIYAAWDDYAAAQGLPPSGKGGKEIAHMNKTESSILWQKIFGFGLIPLAAMMVYAWIGTFSRWVAADENGVMSSAGQTAPWASMTKLDKIRWPKKGIAFLHYEDADKRINQRILLDDFKFDRVATEQIVRAIEAHLKDDQIVGDIRETERDKKKAAALTTASVQESAPADGHVKTQATDAPSA